MGVRYVDVVNALLEDLTAEADSKNGQPAAVTGSPENEGDALSFLTQAFA